MPKRPRGDNKQKSGSKRTKTTKTRKRRIIDSLDWTTTKSKRTKGRNYSDRWYKWRKHLNDAKLANPSLEFWEVLLIASDTYDTIAHEPIISWEDEY